MNLPQISRFGASPAVQRLPLAEWFLPTALAVSAAVASSSARAQPCQPQWLPGEGLPGLNSYAQATWATDYPARGEKARGAKPRVQRLARNASRRARAKKIIA